MIDQPSPGTSTLSVALRRDGASVCVIARGELDIYSTPQLEAQIAAGFELGDDVVVDLAGVDMIDSTGLRLLIGTQRTAQRRGHQVRFVLPTGAAAATLRITGLDELLST